MKLQFKNFTLLSSDEIIFVHKMRNSDIVRLKMYNQEVIPLEIHKEWVAHLIERTDCCYYLVYADEEAIGVVDFTSISNSKDSCEWGYYLKEKYINSGYGILLEYYVLKYAFEALKVDKLFCSVLDSNFKVYNMHKKYFGFSEDECYSVNKKGNGTELNFKGLSLLKTDYEKWDNLFVERSLKFFNVDSVEFIN